VVKLLQNCKFRKIVGIEKVEPVAVCTAFDSYVFKHNCNNKSVLRT
jgi:hypothetical protein